ncbi:MAG: histidine kinase [Bacteroidetes bacterium]|nr:histidine kinase [Bacteroidota bacterium]
MKHWLAIASCYLCTVFLASGQGSKPLFFHFTPQNGLPSSQIYQVLQDKSGYLWFASDHGLAKYNGYEFKKFTSADGLEDNTVFKMVLDSRNRVWLQTFSGRLFYVDNDSIYNYKFNPVIVNLVKNYVPLNFYVDSLENVTFSCSHLGEYRIHVNGKVEQLFSSKVNTEYNKMFFDEIAPGRFVSSANSLADLQKPSWFYFRNSLGVYDSLSLTREQSGPVFVRRLHDKRLIISISNRLYNFSGNQLQLLMELPVTINHIYEDTDHKLWVATYNGIYLFRYEQELTKEAVFLKNDFVTCSHQDFEGGFWISTVNSGVYYLNDLRIKSFRFENDSLLEPLCLTADKSNVYAGFWSGGVAAFNADISKCIYPLGAGDYVTGVFADSSSNRIYLAKKYPGYLYNKKFFSLKSDGTQSLKGRFIRRRNGDFLNASINAVYKIDGDSLFLFTSIYNRTNCVFENEDESLYLGTNSGVSVLNNEMTESRLLHNDFEDVRVDDIARFDKILCFATRGNGLMLMRNDTVWSIKAKDGLCSDIIHRIAIGRNTIWCSSYNGLSKVIIKDFEKKEVEIRNISINEGLPDNEINDLIIKNDTVWLATKSTVSFFNVNTDFLNAVSPLLHFTKLSVNNKDTSFVKELNYDENSISIGFEAISYKSNKRIYYTYFLVHNSDTFTSVTTNRHVEFLSLEPGKYFFSVSARNSTGTLTENPITYQFTVLTPFWKQWWFLGLLAMITLALVYLFTRSRIRSIKEKEQLKTDFNKQLLSLEMKALRAQMNPHFIFNVMNSIQDFILKNDTKSAQKYLTKFARLVRMILDNSLESEVLLNDEIKANCLYVELEQQRFGGKFDFVLDVDEEIESLSLRIPPMLIQPFLENAIKHGIGHLETHGRLLLQVKIIGNDLHIVVEDNGVGRKAAMEWNIHNVRDHNSFGSVLSVKRVEVLNAIMHTNISLEIKDLFHEDGLAAGTRVSLLFSELLQQENV